MNARLAARGMPLNDMTRIEESMDAYRARRPKEALRTLAALIRTSPSPQAHLFLARAHLKSGPARHAQALRYIREASTVRRIPEVELAFARYYEVAEPNVDLAKRYLVRGALRGSIAGAFALARVLRQTGCAGQARVVDVLRMLATPFVLLVIGRRSFRAFDGY